MVREIEDQLREFLKDVIVRSLPDRIALHLVSGRGCTKVGPSVKQFRSMSSEDLDAEKLATSLVQAAQQDCKALGFAQKYGVLVFDIGHNGDYSSRFILPMRSRG